VALGDRGEQLGAVHARHAQIGDDHVSRVLLEQL